MVKVKYIDHEGSAEEVEVFGAKFTNGKATDVSADVAARLAGNRFFEVESSSTKVEPTPVAPKATKQAAPKATKPDPETEKPAVPSADALEAVHRGRGVYAIVKGEDVLKEGLSKEDADTFNGLSDEDKAEYVK
jgi:hypothetical protein